MNNNLCGDIGALTFDRLYTVGANNMSGICSFGDKLLNLFFSVQT